MKKTDTKIKRKHIEMFEYHDRMSLFDSGKLTIEEVKELEEDIKSWELFRIQKLVGLSPSDSDGIPTPILQKKLKEWSNVDFNGGGNERYYINCFDIVQFGEDEDNKKLHHSQNSKLETIGKYYRTLEHQHMLYRIHYKMNRKRGK